MIKKKILRKSKHSMFVWLSLLLPSISLNGYAQDSKSYEQQFVERYGRISSTQTWNMAVRQSLTVTTEEPSTVTVFGTIASDLRGSKKLAIFNNVSGTQVLRFDRPYQVESLYVLIVHSGSAQGYVVPVTNAVVNEKEGIPTDEVVKLSDHVKSATKDVPVDQYALNVLGNGSDNSGKVTQSSQYISDGKPVVITPVYSDCGYNNTFGIYIQNGTGIGQRLDLWTKTSNHTSGTVSRPVFTITLPAGVVYGFYIRNGGGTYYSDASLNQSNARSAGVFQGENCWYLAFEDMPLNGDMDYNDMVFKVESSTQILDNDPAQWTVAVEVDEESSDFDFNDAVFKFSYVEGDGYITFIPLASGTKKRVEVYFNGELLGEMHEMLRTSGYDFVNVIDDGIRYLKPVTEYPFKVNAPEGFSISDKMGGFTIKVDGRIIAAPETGKVPQMLLISSGEWRWLTEGRPIEKGYPDFPWMNDDEEEEDDEDNDLHLTKGDNRDNLNERDGEETNVVIDEQTYKAYVWNTLCVPFDATAEQINDALGEDADVEELVRSTYDEETLLLTLYFTPRTEIVAGMPYVVRVSADISNPKFQDVTISNVTPKTIVTTFCSMTGDYSATSLTAGDRNMLFIANNHFYYPSTTGSLPATKCWFTLMGEAKQDKGDESHEIKGISLAFDNDSSTGILDIETEEMVGSNGWYTLQGVRVSKPQRGIYIHNGKKIIVK